MVTRMGIRQLRDSLTATLRRVRRGETIEVTHHGVPVAILVPVPADRIEHLVAAGDVSPAHPLDHWPTRSPATGGLTASEALGEDRAER